MGLVQVQAPPMMTRICRCVNLLYHGVGREALQGSLMLAPCVAPWCGVGREAQTQELAAELMVLCALCVVIVVCGAPPVCVPLVRRRLPGWGV